MRATVAKPIDSPKLIEPSSKVPVSSCSLRAAYEGWDKMEQRPTSTRMEFSRGIDRFIELHGDLDVGQINKRHVREFREAAQLVPKHRPGKLRKARLPELVEWSREASRYGLHCCGHHQQVADMSSGRAELGAQERCHPR